MYEPYRVEFFKYEDGTEPVRLFIIHLDLKKQAIISSGIGILEQIGLDILQMNCGNNINDHLWEVKKGNVRVIFTKQEKIFYLLHGFEKNQRTTPRADLQIAEDRYEELMRSIKK